MNGMCQKCGGLVVVDKVLDYYGPDGGLRCVNCGWHCRNLPPTPRMENHPLKRGAYK